LTRHNWRFPHFRLSQHRISMQQITEFFALFGRGIREPGWIDPSGPRRTLGPVPMSGPITEPSPLTRMRRLLTATPLVATMSVPICELDRIGLPPWRSRIEDLLPAKPTRSHQDCALRR
jgi:hypothetical protein